MRLLNMSSNGGFLIRPFFHASEKKYYEYMLWDNGCEGRTHLHSSQLDIVVVTVLYGGMRYRHNAATRPQASSLVSGPQHWLLLVR